MNQYRTLDKAKQMARPIGIGSINVPRWPRRLKLSVENPVGVDFDLIRESAKLAVCPNVFHDWSVRCCERRRSFHASRAGP